MAARSELIFRNVTAEVESPKNIGEKGIALRQRESPNIVTMQNVKV
jgi:hypothetical protein